MSTRGQQVLRDPTTLGALAVLALGVSIAVSHQAVRYLEAWFSAEAASSLGVVQASQVGSAVVFPLDGRLVGFTITPGCSVAFLLPFFFVVAAGLLAFGRISIRRAMVMVSAVSVTLFAVNQVRLLIVSASMQGWGFETGYERSHVLLGTMASTIGVILGIFLFLFLATRPDKVAMRRG